MGSFRFAQSSIERRLVFWCPGCEEVHTVPITGPRAWAYDADKVAPTLAPSIKVTTENVNAPARICHSFLRRGILEFLSDCTHKLAGQSAAVPEWPYAPGTYGGIEEEEEVA